MVTDHFLLVTHGMFIAESFKKHTGQRIFCSYLWSVYQQVIWEEGCKSSIAISVLNLCPVDIHRQPVIAVIFCNHYAVQSCLSDVTVFGIIPKAHEKYSRAVLSAAELCQLSFQAGGVLFFFFTELIPDSHTLAAQYFWRSVTQLSSQTLGFHPITLGLCSKLPDKPRLWLLISLKNQDITASLESLCSTALSRLITKFFLIPILGHSPCLPCE